MSRENGRDTRDTEEQERIDRFLAWRSAQGRAPRPPWRVVVIGSVAVAAFALAGNVLLAWLMSAPRLEDPPRAVERRASSDAPPARSPARPVAPPSVARSPAVPPAAVTPRAPRIASTPPPALPPRSQPSLPPRRAEPPAHPEPSPVYDASPVTDPTPGPVTASVAPDTAGTADAPPPPGPADTMPMTRPPASGTAGPAHVPPLTPPPAVPAPDPSVTSPPPAASRPACGPGILRAPSTADGRTRGQAVADCVGGWVKGEAQEFRDGVKREIGEFRAGYDRVRRGLRDLGAKIRGTD